MAAMNIIEAERALAPLEKVLILHFAWSREIPYQDTTLRATGAYDRAISYLSSRGWLVLADGVTETGPMIYQLTEKANAWLRAVNEIPVPLCREQWYIPELPHI